MLDGLPERIKALDEPALRVFLRLQVATFLWANKRTNASGRAEAMTTEALADLIEHESEIPEFYANSFRRDAMALLELHAPALAASLSKRFGLDQKEDQLATAHQLLNRKDGVGAAVEKIHGFLKSGRDPGDMMTFLLLRLEVERPDEVPRLLAEILNSAERIPGSISFQTLFFLKHQYMKEGGTPELKGRFIDVFVKSAQEVSAKSESENFLLAYGVLSDILPTIGKLRPSLYPQASALAATLGARLPRQSAEREAIDDRIRQSADPLNQTIAEAEAARDSSLKESLFTEAARLAVKKGQLKTAVDLITKAESPEPNRVAHRDQFLGDVVIRALDVKDPATAAYAAAGIRSPLKRSSALQRIALYFFESEDVARARETLNDALHLIRSAEDGVNRISSLL
ncbi:MAG: hypothetical protein ACRD68_13010, partial [Pyrinomonadaceae bacterium]